eukprot:2269746-Amphidinium_carterae.1
MLIFGVFQRGCDSLELLNMVFKFFWFGKANCNAFGFHDAVVMGLIKIAHSVNTLRVFVLRSGNWFSGWKFTLRRVGLQIGLGSHLVWSSLRVLQGGKPIVWRTLVVDVLSVKACFRA